MVGAAVQIWSAKGFVGVRWDGRLLVARLGASNGAGEAVRKTARELIDGEG